MLKFDETAHKYFLNGLELPSVTRILSDAGLVDARWFDDWSRDRGRAVHKAIELYNNDDLIEEGLDPVIVPYLEAWKEFQRQTKCVITHSELQVHSELYGYAGTLDISGTINGKSVIIDIKSGAVGITTGLQLAGYALTFPNYYGIERYGLRLQPNGKQSIKPFTDRNDFPVWQSFVACHHWRENNLKGRK